MQALTAPSGFIPHNRRSPVTDAWEPLFSRAADGVVSLGFHLAERHCNGRGMLHGGVIASLADNAMGLSLAAEIVSRGETALQGLVTVCLSVDYIGAAAHDQWIEFTPRVVSVGSGSGVVDCLVRADGDLIARANATFRVKR